MVDHRLKFTESEENLIRSLAKGNGLFYETAAILYSRGVREHRKIFEFMHPGKKNFLDPFKMSGMLEAVQRIAQARDEGETVAIYGDYDADGISATTILYKGLKIFGIDAITVIPERSDGYGLRRAIVDSLLDEYFPTLVITVDCGISGHDEVEYLKECGADVIVTDHHELPELLPECIVVNCKIPSEYGFDGLCGAGVAYKLVRALIGERADEFLDLAAIATIADSMPLIGENRDIVYEGLNLIRRGRGSMAINQLISVCAVREISATGLAFSVAPRINAAGRMGDAKSALALMKSDDPKTVIELADKLNAYNTERQAECEKLYQAARQKLVAEAYDKKIIVLEDDAWNSGLVGIIAARLVEEFSRPVILFVGNNGRLHGSARSIPEINIFEAVSACKEYLIDFGGHAQAAGITVDADKFDDFSRAIEKYVDENYGYEVFTPKKSVEMEIKSKFTVKLAKELSRLEPFGTGNKKPLFSVKPESIKAEPVKQGSPHYVIKTDYIDLLIFNGAPMLELLGSGADAEFIFEPNVSFFRNEESLKGYVRSVDFSVPRSERISLAGFKASLLTVKNPPEKRDRLTGEEIKKAVDSAINGHYGAFFAVYNPKTLESYPELSELDVSLFEPSGRNLSAGVVIAARDCKINGYRRAVFLDGPLGAAPQLGEGLSVSVSDKYAFDYRALKTDKATMGDVFRKIRDSSVCAGDSVEFALKAQDRGYTREQLVFALEVFLELGFFKFGGDGLKTTSVRAELTQSEIYNAVNRLKDGL